MKTSCYIIVSGKKAKYMNWVEPGPMRMTKNKPSLKSNEVAIKVNIDLPDALFQKPSMEVSLSAPAPEPVTLDPEVQDQIAQIIADQTGMNVNISFEAPEED